MRVQCIIFCNVWFQKMSIPTPRKVIGNSEGEGVSKAKIFKGKFEAELEIPGLWQDLAV